MSFTALAALHVAMVCAAAGIALTALEAFWHLAKGHYGEDGIWPWRIMREAYAPGTAALLTPVMRGQAVAMVFGVRLAAAGAVPVLLWTGTGLVWPLVVLIGTQFMLSLRTRWGGEGADQMTVLVLLSGLAAELSRHTPAIATCAALFIGGQITLSYLASGGAKLFGPLWRSGDALRRIMNQHQYGHPAMVRLLTRYPLLGRGLCLSVMGFQVSFLLFYLLPMPYALIYPLGGILFHAGIAYCMRLNLFLITFVGTYPCLLFTHELVHRALLG